MTYAQISGTHILGLAGPARAGKDTAAKFLFAIDPIRTECYAFSDAITVHCRLNYGMTKRDPKMLQRIGLDARLVNPRIWLDALYWRIDEDRPRLAIITGVRFPDEVAMVHAMGGAVVWIERVAADGRCLRSTDRDPLFPTETSLVATDCDRRIENPDENLVLFRTRVLGMYEQLFPVCSYGQVSALSHRT